MQAIPDSIVFPDFSIYQFKHNMLKRFFMMNAMTKTYELTIEDDADKHQKKIYGNDGCILLSVLIVAYGFISEKINRDDAHLMDELAEVEKIFRSVKHVEKNNLGNRVWAYFQFREIAIENYSRKAGNTFQKLPREEQETVVQNGPPACPPKKSFLEALQGEQGFALRCKTLCEKSVSVEKEDYHRLRQKYEEVLAQNERYREKENKVFQKMFAAICQDLNAQEWLDKGKYFIKALPHFTKEEFLDEFPGGKTRRSWEDLFSYFHEFDEKDDAWFMHSKKEFMNWLTKETRSS